MKDSDSKSRRKKKLEPNGPPFVPPEIIPDSLRVPDNTILLVPDSQDFVDPTHFVKAGQQRDWFDAYFYHCLPLVMGNQHGFLLLSTHDFVCRWNGKNDVDGVSIHMLEPVLEPNYVTLASHFGFGILTIQSRYVYRTPKGVNLMVKAPPNYPIDGFSWMDAVVETDNIRRDFTFNIKITRPNLDIYIPRNTPLGCLLPYPRYFLDDYNISELKDPVEIRKSERTVNYFSIERDDFDKSPRHRYMEGVDIYNIEFEHHQKTLDKGKWWFSQRNKHVPVKDYVLTPILDPYSRLLSGVGNVFRRFLVLAARAMVPDEEASQNANSGAVIAPSQDVTSCPVQIGKVIPKPTAESAFNTHKLEEKTTMTSDDESGSLNEGKCPVKHGLGPSTSNALPNSALETARMSLSLKPENFPEIMELNADLPESTISIYLPPFYDKTLAPVKAERLRSWMEEDSKTKDHARFCLPLTMGSGLGWFILSPATFTVTWDGDPTHDADVEILDASSHAEIDNHSAHGAFTIQSQFIPRTKKPGDFVVIRGITNSYRLPYYLLDAMLEAWWSPANFGLVALLNQAGKFKIKKGEPVAQMFVVNVEQAAYPIALKDGYPAHWKEWDDKRRDASYTGKNFDYLKGLWPDETPVCPHFKSWSLMSAAPEKSTPNKVVEKVIKDNSRLSVADLIREARVALSLGKNAGAEEMLNIAEANAAKEGRVNVDLISTFHSLGYSYMRQSNYPKATAILSQSLELSRRFDNSESKNLMVSILHDLAFTERSQRNLKLAEQHYKEALEILTATSKDEAKIANGMFYLGSVLDQMGLHVDAEPLIVESLEIMERKLGQNHPDTLFTKNGLACLYTHLHKLDEAEQLFADVINKRREVLGADSLDLADSYNDLGFLHLESNNLTKGEDAFKHAAAIRAEKLGEDSLGVAEFLNNLAFLYRKHKDYGQAKDYFEKVLAIQERHRPFKDPELIHSLQNLAQAYVDLGDQEKANELFERAET